MPTCKKQGDSVKPEKEKSQRTEEKAQKEALFVFFPRRAQRKRAENFYNIAAVQSQEAEPSPLLGFTAETARPILALFFLQTTQNPTLLLLTTHTTHFPTPHAIDLIPSLTTVTATPVCAHPSSTKRSFETCLASFHSLLKKEVSWGQGNIIQDGCGAFCGSVK